MLEKYDVYLRPFNCQRTLHIYLPNDYYQSDERYPVVNMFDGHNLFLNSDATYGKSWGLADFLDHYDKKLIIVGIECNHEGNERLSEYCPYNLNSRYFERVQGKGIQTLDWLVYELKPMIDQKYRTYPFRECTAIAGSSMGGLMAFYGVIKYNQYISKAACLSPAFGLCKKRLERDLPQNLNPDTRIYMSLGTEEFKRPQRFIKNIQEFNDYIVSQGATSYINIIPGGHHNESEWEKQNELYMNVMWK